MKFLRILLAPALIFLACHFNKPTPLAIGDLRADSDKAAQLYIECVDGLVYQPKKEGCQAQALEETLGKVRQDAKYFISSDIKQPHGYEIYLKSTMIYFQVARRVENDYSEAEKIARQFFEIQKATSGHSLDEARFYWTVTMAEHLAFQANEAMDAGKAFALTEERKEEIKVCIGEALSLVVNLPDGPRKSILFAYMDVLHVMLVL